MSAELKKEFLKRLGALTHSHTQREHFENFIECAYCSLAQRGIGASQSKDELEARYMRMIGKYEQREDRDQLARLMGIVFRTDSYEGDFLGEIAGEISALDAGQGQFFTPYSVSRLVAEMNLPTELPALGFFKAMEPACGSGGMVIAAKFAMIARGMNPTTEALWHCTDINNLAYRMAVIQFCVHGIAGIVVRGDSLRGEEHEWAWTLPTTLFYEKHGRLFNDPPKPARHRSRAEVFPAAAE